MAWLNVMVVLALFVLMVVAMAAIIALGSVLYRMMHPAGAHNGGLRPLIGYCQLCVESSTPEDGADVK